MSLGFRNKLNYLDPALLVSRGRLFGKIVSGCTNSPGTLDLAGKKHAKGHYNISWASVKNVYIYIIYNKKANKFQPTSEPLEICLFLSTLNLFYS